MLIIFQITDSYITYTAHYLDQNYDGTLKSKVLECAKFDKRHTSENLKEDMERICDEFNIQTKKTHVNVDNAANVQGAVHALDCDCDGCTAHKFNLVAKDGIKNIPEVKEVQTKMNGTIKFTKKSNEGKKFFMECQTLAEFEGKYIHGILIIISDDEILFLKNFFRPIDVD